MNKIKNILKKRKKYRESIGKRLIEAPKRKFTIKSLAKRIEMLDPILDFSFACATGSTFAVIFIFFNSYKSTIATLHEEIPIWLLSPTVSNQIDYSTKLNYFPLVIWLIFAISSLFYFAIYKYSKVISRLIMITYIITSILLTVALANIIHIAT